MLLCVLWIEKSTKNGKSIFEIITTRTLLWVYYNGMGAYEEKNYYYVAEVAKGDNNFMLFANNNNNNWNARAWVYIIFRNVFFEKLPLELNSVPSPPCRRHNICSLSGVRSNTKYYVTGVPAGGTAASSIVGTKINLRIKTFDVPRIELNARDYERAHTTCRPAIVFCSARRAPIRH